jgi:hypothetical protein
LESGQVLFPKSYDLQMDSRLAGLLDITQSMTLSQSAPQTYSQNLESPKSVKPGKSPGLLSGGTGSFWLRFQTHGIGWDAFQYR